MIADNVEGKKEKKGEKERLLRALGPNLFGLFLLV